MASAAQLQQALEALYHHADPAVKEQANTWLEGWQQSQEAWQVCNDVLHSAEAGMEVHYFAALTLRTKVGRRRGGGARCRPAEQREKGPTAAVIRRPGCWGR